MNVKIKKLHENAVTPKKATKGSAAYDLYVCEDITIHPGRQVVPLGFAIEMPENIEAKIEARSGFSSKGMEGYDLVGLDTIKTVDGLKVVKYVAVDPSRFDADVITGKVDSDYRDSVGVIINSRHPFDFVIKAGTKIAQMTFYKVENADFESVEELSETDRQGGFGSTGTK